MSAGVNLTDAVVAKLQEGSFGSATIERQLIPKLTREDLDLRIIVVLQGMTSVEQDRGGDWIQYRIGVGLTYPVNAVEDHEAGINMAEAIQDWLLQRDNKNLSTVNGTYTLVPPYDMETLYDADQVDAAGVMFCVTNFNYRFYKDRT